jgi:hypothetical protein
MTISGPPHIASCTSKANSLLAFLRRNCSQMTDTRYFILQNYELSYLERLRKLNLLPISYWLEIKDLIFFSNANKASTSKISPLLSPFLLIAHLAPVQARTTYFKSIRAKPLFLETLFLIELYMSSYGTISLQSFVTVRLFHPLNSSSILTTLLN